jgi:hypothetical protein
MARQAAELVNVPADVLVTGSLQPRSRYATRRPYPSCSRALSTRLLKVWSPTSPTPAETSLV